MKYADDPAKPYKIREASIIFILPNRSIKAPIMGEKRAINSAGTVSINFVKISE
jgi:hypothetical protein